MSQISLKVAALTAGAVLMLAAQAHAVIITVGNATGAAGAIVSVEVSMTAEGTEEPAGTANDITFPTGARIVADEDNEPLCEISPVLAEDFEKDLSSAFQPPGCEGTSVLSEAITADATTIPVDDDGPFPNAGTVQIGDELISYTDADDDTLTGATRGVDGTTAAPHAAGDAVTNPEPCTGFRGLILALDNTDPFPSGLLYTCQWQIAAGATGALPLACSEPGASDEDGEPLPATCVNGAITVGGVEPTNTATPPTEGPTATPTPTTEAEVNIVVGSGTGEIGAEVAIEVSFTLPLIGTEVAGTSNEITFAEGENPPIRIKKNEDGDPDCEVSSVLAEEFEKDLSAAFQPPGCEGTSTLSEAITADATTIPVDDDGVFPESGTVRIGEELISYTGTDDDTLTGATRGVDGTTAAAHAVGDAVTNPVPCTGFKGLILSLTNTDPFPAGLLYTCIVQITTAAQNGNTYPLTCSAPGASDPDGVGLTASCTSGSVTVGGGPTPTATVEGPTPTVSAGPTNTPPTVVPPVVVCDDGCAIASPATESQNGWLLLLPAAMLLWLRRRSR